MTVTKKIYRKERGKEKEESQIDSQRPEGGDMLVHKQMPAMGVGKGQRKKREDTERTERRVDEHGRVSLCWCTFGY